MEVCSGSLEKVSFKIGTKCSNTISYQWYVINMKTRERVIIKGANSSTLTLDTPTGGWTSKSTYAVHCEVTCQGLIIGISTMEVSDNASIIIRNKPYIYSHPSNQSVNEREPVTFSVSVSGSSPITYTWKKNGIAIPGAPNSNKFTLDSVTLSDAGDYSCTVSNPYGCGDPYTSKQGILSVIKQDYPDSWFKQETSPIISYVLNGVSFVNELTGWIVTSEPDYLLKTSNGGLDWSVVNTGSNTYWCDIYFNDLNHGWVSGYSRIAYTTNGGNSWTVYNLYDSLGLQVYISEIYFINSSTGWVGPSGMMEPS